MNNPTFYIPGIDGYGAALSLNISNSQYVNVSIYRNLTYVSFTIEMWFYCTSLAINKNALFGQHSAVATDQSLHMQIRGNVLYLSFYADDLTASTIVKINTWYHAAFVYDYSLSVQKIYLNGQLDGNRSSSAYQGTSGPILIGRTDQNPGSPDYFPG